MQEAQRRFVPLVRGAWIFAVVLWGASIGLGGFYLVPHWLVVVATALGIFLVSVVYAKRNDAVMAELGNSSHTDHSDAD